MMASTNEDDRTAFNQNAGAFVKGLTPEQVTAYYNSWAQQESYEAHLNRERYLGPAQVAEAASRYLGDRKDAHILDIAAGTGRVGEELFLRGFTNIDGLEPTPNMIKEAENKHVYKKFINDFMTANPLPIEAGTYDAITISGGMGEAHIPTEALLEMIRLVKRGGYICNAMREEYLTDVEDYKDRLEPFMDKLEAEGKWRKLERYTTQKYFCEKTGVIHVYQVL